MQIKIQKNRKKNKSFVLIFAHVPIAVQVPAGAGLTFVIIRYAVTLLESAGFPNAA